MAITKGHEVKYLRCPHCMNKSVMGRSTATVGCTVCKKWWTTYTDYIKLMSEKGLIIDGGDTEPVDYINSGDLHEDMQKLIAAVQDKTEVDLLNALIGWLPTLDRSGEGTVHLSDLVRALEDLRAGRWHGTGVK